MITPVQKYLAGYNNIVCDWLVKEIAISTDGVFEREVLHLLYRNFSKDEIKKIIKGHKLHYGNFEFSTTGQDSNFTCANLTWLLNREEFEFNEDDITREYSGLLDVIYYSPHTRGYVNPINHPKINKYKSQFCEYGYWVIKTNSEELQEKILNVAQDRRYVNILSLLKNFKKPTDKIQNLAIKYLKIKTVVPNNYSSIQTLKKSMEFQKLSDENKEKLINMIKMGVVLDK